MKVGVSKGFTLVEVLMALMISVTLFGSMMAAYLAVKSINVMSRHKIQAVQVVRGQMENMKAMPFASITNAATNPSLNGLATAYDAGPNGTFGNADDKNGVLTTTVQDLVDFDNDGNTAETQINVDNVAGNDAVAVPVRVSFAWSERVLGSTRNMTVSADTIIGS